MTSGSKSEWRSATKITKFQSGKPMLLKKPTRNVEFEKVPVAQMWGVSDMNYQNQLFFPIDAAPLLIRDAILEINTNLKAPAAIIASSALGVLSLACQGLIDVLLPHGQVKPVSLFLITIADSGERKTSCDQLFTKPIRDFDDKSNEIHETAMQEYEAEIFAWELKSKALISQILKLETKELGDVT